MTLETPISSLYTIFIHLSIFILSHDHHNYQIATDDQEVSRKWGYPQIIILSMGIQKDPFQWRYLPKIYKAYVSGRFRGYTPNFYGHKYINIWSPGSSILKILEFPSGWWFGGHFWHFPIYWVANHPN